MKQIGDSCYPNKNAEFLTALDKQLERIDQFIVENAPMTRDQLEQLKQNPTFKPETALLCQEDTRRLYEAISSAGRKSLMQVLRTFYLYRESRCSTRASKAADFDR